MNRNDILIINLINRNPKASITSLSKQSSLPLKAVTSIYKTLTKRGIIKNGKIDGGGLVPYKVNNAIIMAAGMSSRFAPISFEKPKGLLKVKNEVLIERQINQLVDIGIKNIILVVGYKKEMFLYLKDKYPFIKIVNNPCYNTKNNIYTLYLVRKYLGNTYICSSDDYFTTNPFDKYVYEAYYAGHYAKEKTDEFYMKLDAKGYIDNIYIGGSKANIMFGHAYFDNRFAKAFIELMEKHHKSGDYDQNLWDVMLMDYLKKLPPMFGKLYPYGVINEFDSLEDLRKFDHKYINHTGIKIMEKISKTLKCKEGEIINFSVIQDEPNNYSFKFKVKNQCYIYQQCGHTHKPKIIKPLV